MVAPGVKYFREDNFSTDGSCWCSLQFAAGPAAPAVPSRAMLAREPSSAVWCCMCSRAAKRVCCVTVAGIQTQLFCVLEVGLAGSGMAWPVSVCLQLCVVLLFWVSVHGCGQCASSAGAGCVIGPCEVQCGLPAYR